MHLHKTFFEKYIIFCLLLVLALPLSALAYTWGSNNWWIKVDPSDTVGTTMTINGTVYQIKASPNGKSIFIPTKTEAEIQSFVSSPIGAQIVKSNPNTDCNATGGTITDDDGYRIHTFTSSGTFTAANNCNAEVLVVAGGGGGGRYGGGGGGGGVVYDSSKAISGAVTVTIGGGGAGWVGDTQNGGNAGSGGNSVFSSLTAIGGGGGGCYGNPLGSSGAAGGSGGGGGNTNGGGTTSGGIGTSGQGYSGGGGPNGNYVSYGAGGGGGAGAAGAEGIAGGKGGAGVAYSISGTSTYYGGGGSGCQASSNLTGGQGGGGTGFAAGVSGNTSIDGVSNTGGGGGGGRDNTISGTWRAGNGGSGIVIIRYPHIIPPPVNPVSCMSIKKGNAWAPDGVYTIDPDGDSGNDPFQVYCDMTYDGGGWTLLMKATRGTTFQYDSNYWTTANTLNSTDITRNDADAKYRSFNELPVTDIMARWPDFGDIRWLKNSAWTATPALTGFNTYHNWGTPQYQSDWNATYFSSEPVQCDAASGGPSIYGTKLADLGGIGGGSRWGYRFNENGCNDWGSDDAGGGIGIRAAGYIVTLASTGASAGDSYGCCGATGANRTARVEVYGRNPDDPSWTMPTPRSSCKAILDTSESIGNGVYTIDPDGAGGNDPFQVYCDMTTDGGGWTLLFNLNTNDANVRNWNDTTFWLGSGTEGNTVNAFSTDYKSKAYSALTLDGEVMMWVHNDGSTNYGHAVYDVVNDYRTSTLYSAMNAGDIVLSAMRKSCADCGSAPYNTETFIGRSEALELNEQKSGSGHGSGSSYTYARVSTTGLPGDSHYVWGLGGDHDCQCSCGHWGWSYEAQFYQSYCDIYSIGTRNGGGWTDKGYNDNDNCSAGNAAIDYALFVRKSCGVCKEPSGDSCVYSNSSTQCATINCSANNYYYISGVASPTGTNYTDFRSYNDINAYCDGSGNCNYTSCNSYSDSLIASCGTCKYATGDASGCANYGAGTSCGSGYACDGAGSCIPIPAPKIVFLGRWMGYGNFGGLAAADAICQSEANSAGLSGTFKAWLSASSASARDRLTHSVGPYKQVNGTQIAANWSDLVSGNNWLLTNRISVAADGGVIGHNACSAYYGDPYYDICWPSVVNFIWTGTNWDGSGTGAYCSDWTDTNSSQKATFGTTARDQYDGTPEWTVMPWATVCYGQKGLYCFEQ
ncbi:MAG: fibrinogen-like YCDxxxxGGGW domain-containing protein [Patescibacteria group bacterium]